MIILDCEQGTAAWHFARLGIPTASAFGDLITKKHELAKGGAETYSNKLLAEMMMGEHEAGYSGGWIQHGKELEPEARQFYEFDQDVELRRVGFIMDDSRTMGCSPDGIVLNADDTVRQGVEIKCPSAHIHMAYMLGNGFGDDYVAQVQGSMMITGAQEWATLSYHKKLPPALNIAKRDDEYIEKLRKVLREFQKIVTVKRQILINRGYTLKG